MPSKKLNSTQKVNKRNIEDFSSMTLERKHRIKEIYELESLLYELLLGPNYKKPPHSEFLIKK